MILPHIGKQIGQKLKKLRSLKSALNGLISAADLPKVRNQLPASELYARELMIPNGVPRMDSYLGENIRQLPKIPIFSM